MKTLSISLVLSFCILAPASVRAQSPDFVLPPKLSLADALKIADERNPGMAGARAAVDVAEADRVTARTRPNPAFTFESEGYPLFRSPLPDFINGQELSLRVDQEIEMGGRRRLRTESADLARKSAEAAVEEQRRRLHLEVRRAYFQLVLARADQEAARASLEEIDKMIAINRTRLEHGEISGGELRRVQVERLRFMDDVFAAELAARNARSTLLALMNAPRLDTQFETSEPLAVAPGLAAVDYSPELLAGVFASRPDFAIATSDRLRADTETRLQKSLATPNLTIGAGYKRDFGENGLIVGMTLPLPLFNRNAGGLARAEAERRMADSRVAATQSAIALDVQQATNAVEISRARVAYIEKEYLQNAREARDIAQASYGEGEADLLDFLDAQRAYRDTQRTYNRALYDYRISLFELDSALGKRD